MVAAVKATKCTLSLVCFERTLAGKGQALSDIHLFHKVDVTPDRRHNGVC